MCESAPADADRCGRVRSSWHEARGLTLPSWQGSQWRLPHSKEAAMDHSHHSHDHLRHASLNATAFRATLHCLSGCAVGEVLGMVLGTALGLSNGATIALA